MIVRLEIFDFRRKNSRAKERKLDRIADKIVSLNNDSLWFFSEVTRDMTNLEPEYATIRTFFQRTSNAGFKGSVVEVLKGYIQ